MRGELELVITRTIDGPARIVFDAWTRVEHLRRWWAPEAIGAPGEGFTADVRTGGRYRYVLRLHGGGELGFSGTYLEVTPPTRLVYTSLFEPRPEAGEVLCTVTFEEHDGKTKIVLHEK
ncbi:MAG: SRPBCC domain-containing protein, partial [Kofleriaceae bacterium]